MENDPTSINIARSALEDHSSALLKLSTQSPTGAETIVEVVDDLTQLSDELAPKQRGTLSDWLSRTFGGASLELAGRKLRGLTGVGRNCEFLIPSPLVDLVETRLQGDEKYSREVKQVPGISSQIFGYQTSLTRFENVSLKRGIVLPGNQSATVTDVRLVFSPGSKAA